MQKSSRNQVETGKKQIKEQAKNRQKILREDEL